MFTFLWVQAEDMIKNLAAEEMPRHRNSEAIYSVQDHAVLHCACRPASFFKSPEGSLARPSTRIWVIKDSGMIEGVINANVEKFLVF
jgi:hypothetical protein